MRVFFLNLKKKLTRAIYKNIMSHETLRETTHKTRLIYQAKRTALQNYKNCKLAILSIYNYYNVKNLNTTRYHTALRRITIELCSTVFKVYIELIISRIIYITYKSKVFNKVSSLCRSIIHTRNKRSITFLFHIHISSCI